MSQREEIKKLLDKQNRIRIDRRNRLNELREDYQKKLKEIMESTQKELHEIQSQIEKLKPKEAPAPKASERVKK